MATISGSVIARPARRRKAGAGHAGGQQTAGRITYAILIVVAIVSVFPLYYTAVIGSHTNHELSSTPPPFLPNSTYFHHLNQALHNAPLVRAMVNSLIVATTMAVGTVLFCTLAGFAFAKLRFRGRNALLALAIATIALPVPVLIVPLFMLMAKLHLAGHLESVILPTLVTGFGVFFMRQYLVRALPTELLEAGWVDGASTFRIFWSIVIPIAKPAMAVLAMFQFLYAWNDFFWPIIALSTSNPTAQVALVGLSTGYVHEQALVMSGTFFVTLPLLVAFVLLGKHIVGGIMNGAVKG